MHKYRHRFIKDLNYWRYSIVRQSHTKKVSQRINKTMVLGEYNVKILYNE